jgi:hypothetical protein
VVASILYYSPGESCPQQVLLLITFHEAEQRFSR